MDESLQNIILSLFSFLSSVAAAARLNDLLAALSERSYRVSQRNFESIVDDSNSRLQTISRILKASRRNRRPRRFWERPWSSKAVSSSVHVKFLSVSVNFFGIVDFERVHSDIKEHYFHAFLNQRLCACTIKNSPFSFTV